MLYFFKKQIELDYLHFCRQNRRSDFPCFPTEIATDPLITLFLCFFISNFPFPEPWLGFRVSDFLTLSLPKSPTCFFVALVLISWEFCFSPNLTICKSLHQLYLFACIFCQNKYVGEWKTIIKGDLVKIEQKSNQIMGSADRMRGKMYAAPMPPAHRHLSGSDRQIIHNNGPGLRVYQAWRGNNVCSALSLILFYFISFTPFSCMFVFFCSSCLSASIFNFFFPHSGSWPT